MLSLHKRGQVVPRVVSVSNNLEASFIYLTIDVTFCLDLYQLIKVRNIASVQN